MNRYLTTSERCFVRMAAQITMNPIVMVRCEGRLEPDRVREAVVKVQRRHPALQVRVVADDRPWFSDHGVPETPLRVVERADATHWERIVTRELNTPFDINRGPLVRFVLVQDADHCELICTTDHVNADGRSGLFVLRDVLRAIDDPTLRFTPLRERSAFDALLPRPWWQPRLSPALQGLAADRFHQVAHAIDAVAPAPPPARPSIGFVRRTLDPERTAAVVERCRAERCSVQSALMVASAMSLADQRGGRRSAIACITPIDIRAQLDPPVGHDFGIYAWAPSSLLYVSPGSNPWRHARWCKQVLAHYRRRSTLAAFQHVVDGMAFTEGTALQDGYGRLLRAASSGAMVVSNLGQVSLPAQAAGARVVGVGFFAMIPDVDFVLAVQTCRGTMELNYCYAGSTRATVERIADGVNDLLTGVA